MADSCSQVRCDKMLPNCQNCIRLGIPCPGYNPDTEFISRKEMQKIADNIFKAAGVEKRRVGSCQECRASKYGCSKDQPSCQRCIWKDVECVYLSKKRGKAAVDKAQHENSHHGTISSPESSIESPGRTVFDSNKYVFTNSVDEKEHFY